MIPSKPQDEVFWRIFRDKSGCYDVRTRHLTEDGKPIFINGLIKESSPYLLQHAHNPVNWMAWEGASFERAKAENKAVFLSIGYATCHWCHVMEHESFEDLTVAEYLNQHFVCIKVDREQHPVVDDFYMTALQLIAGQGGWPMSVFLTPDAAPFMAGTYFPQPRFLELLSQINGLWQEQQDKLIQQAARVKQTVTRYLSADSVEPGQQLSASHINHSVDKLKAELIEMSDDVNGGFASAPKFPQEAWLQFLMHQYLDSNDSASADVLKLSLKKMQQSGLHDHVAGGFHRYCVDEDWLVPHFEKMLYNQAQLLQLYAQAAVVFANGSLSADNMSTTSFAETAQQIVAFVKAEMLSEQGLFYSALDADSLDERGDMVEGAYYVWSWQELESLLTVDELSWLSTHYAVFPAGNFEGKNVLFQRDSEAIDDSFLTTQSTVMAKLKHARLPKPRPLTDDKVIVSWNAMMIEALARASVLLNDESMGELAQSVYKTLWQTHWHNETLWRVSQSGQRQNIPAVLSDYANVASAALALRDMYLPDEAAHQFYQSAVHQLLAQIHQKFWQKGVLYQAEVKTNDPWQPQVVNAKDGATVSATAKLLQVLASVEASIEASAEASIEALWPEFGTWFDDILSSQTKSMAQQNTAHSGLLTAALQRKNHVLGQNTIEKIGIQFSLKKCNDMTSQKGNKNTWQLSYQSQAPWHINQIRIEQNGAQIDGKTAEESHDNADSAVLELTGFKAGLCQISWQLCDDKQCLPEQQLQLFLI